MPYHPDEHLPGIRFPLPEHTETVQEDCRTPTGGPGWLRSTRRSPTSDRPVLATVPLPLYVDPDAIDASEAPGLLFPTPGHRTDEVIALVHTIPGTGRVTALSASAAPGGQARSQRARGAPACSPP